MLPQLKDVVIQLHDIARTATDPVIANAVRQLADAAASLVKTIKQTEIQNENNR